MKQPMPFFHLILSLLFLSAAACVPITPYGDTGTYPGGEITTPDGGAGTPDSGGAIGVLHITGPNVWLNDSPATDGAPVYLGNSVATGAGSYATVEFADGGYLQVDENTDPDWEWLEESMCLLIRIFKGRVYLKKSQTCVQTLDLSLKMDSEVNLVVPPPPAPTEVTVIRGSAEVTLPTQRLKLVQGQQLRAIAHAPEVKNVSPAVTRSLTEWHTQFPIKRLRTPVRPDRVIPGRTRPIPVTPVPVTPDRGAPDQVGPVPVTPVPVTPVPVTPDGGTLEQVTPVPVTPDRGTREQVRPVPVRPAPVTVAPVTPVPVTPVPVTPAGRVAPLPAIPERVITTPDTGSTAQPPVSKQPSRIPRILRPKSTPVPENVQ